MRRRLAILAALLPGTAAADCGADLGEGPIRRLEGPGYTVAFVPLPAEIAPARLFALRVAVCGRDGHAAPALMRVGAWMPEHGHGMNYAPSLSATGNGRWHVDGLMFHMPGRWQITFDLGTAERSERLSAEERIE